MVEVEQPISQLPAQTCVISFVEWLFSRSDGDRRCDAEKYGLKDPDDRGKLISSESFAALRMTAKTCNAKNMVVNAARVTI
jgi:hypothetical protein